MNRTLNNPGDIVKWKEISKHGHPQDKGSDTYYLVMLHGFVMTISYFFIDSFGPSWSSQWDIWDKAYSDGEVTHWAECPDGPNLK
jgi:hypothetical protein